MRERFFSNGKWYYTLTILTVGLFAWVPFLHAAARTHTRRPRRFAVVYGVAAVGLAGLSSLAGPAQDQPFGANLSTVVAVSAIVLMATACYQLHSLRLAAYRLNDPHRVLASASDEAVAEVLAARQRRDQARALAQRDPLLARDLSIGRPDQTRQFDDGGLVDLNSSSAELLVAVCGLDRRAAEQVVRTRGEWGTGFSSVEEVLAYVDMSERDANVLRDRGIVLHM